jgi:hypothetical protein
MVVLPHVTQAIARRINEKKPFYEKRNKIEE